MWHGFLGVGLAAVVVACTKSANPEGAPARTSPESGAEPMASAAPLVSGPPPSLRAYAPLEVTCSVDAACGLAPTPLVTESSVGCCVTCGEYTAGTKAWVAKARAACLAVGPCSLGSSCMAAAEPDPNGAKCVKSRCVAVVKP